MATVYIDDKPYEVQEQKNMLQVILDNKLDLPYFCWHPAMGSVGACRQCAVKSFKGEADKQGKINMACMMPAMDGTRISISDPEAMAFRRYIIEWLMLNHPHDCPVCDEGGECHLQDMTVMSGQIYRRYRGKKRTYRNQNLGPLVNHEMNRCIQCYRCVRFYRDYAGGRDFNVFASKDHVYFGRYEDGALESEFSGNLVEICPTGVFTDKTLKRHYTRKWDLENAPSICIHCGLGCNTIPGARYAELRRIRARYNSEVNGYFLCDRGRYGYEFVNSELRIRHPLSRTNGEKTETSWAEAIEKVRNILASASGVIGVGSPCASLEANYALKKLVCADAFSTGLSSYEHRAAQLALEILREGRTPTPSLAEVETADAILIVGADSTNEAPMLDYAVRQAMRKSCLDVSRQLGIPDWDDKAVLTALQGSQGKLSIAAICGTKLEAIATAVLHTDFDGLVTATSEISASLEPDHGTNNFTSITTKNLRDAERPLIITSISTGERVLQAAANLAWTLTDDGKECRLSIIMPEANTMGVTMLGGISADDAFKRIEQGSADTMIVLENDLSRRINQSDFKSLIEKVKNLIVLDSIETPTSEGAGIVLPASTWVECDGTFVSSEGRAQRFYQVFVPSGSPKTAWQIVGELSPELSWNSYEEVLRDLSAEHPTFSPALDAAPSADWRSPAGQKIARESHRSSGRTAKYANRSVREPEPVEDPQTPFNFSMEGTQNPPPGPLIQRDWWPGWNSMQSITKFQMEVNATSIGGNSGKRLIEATVSSHLQFETPGPTTVKDGVWVVPRAHIFGTELLSSLSPAIMELSPLAHASISPGFAKELGVNETEEIQFEASGEIIRLPCKLDASLPINIVTVPANIGIVEPVKSNIARAT